MHSHCCCQQQVLTFAYPIDPQRWTLPLCMRVSLTHWWMGIHKSRTHIQHKFYLTGNSMDPHQSLIPTQHVQHTCQPQTLIRHKQHLLWSQLPIRRVGSLYAQCKPYMYFLILMWHNPSLNWPHLLEQCNQGTCRFHPSTKHNSQVCWSHFRVQHNIATH